MPAPKIITSVTFRRAVAFAALFIASNLSLFAFIYWQTAVYETGRIQNLIEHQAEALAQASPGQIDWSIQQRVSSDLHRVTFLALLDANGQIIEGNLQSAPADLPVDGKAHGIALADIGEEAGSSEPVFAVARRLPDQRVLIIGRNIQELGTLGEIVIRALKLGVIPMAFFAVLIGAILSLRINLRLKLAQQVLERVQEGQLDQRLPVGTLNDEFASLSKDVNAMLAELERLMHELHHVGNNIAHDLRTPLARVRAQLERAQRLLPEQSDVAEIIDRAIAGLDQTFSLTTALLRVAEMETGRSRTSFRLVDLNEIANEAAELYEPLAEAKRIAVSLASDPLPAIRGDRDLLLELIANLLDNAIKFTPCDGSVKVDLANTAKGPVITLSDTGPGIDPAHRLDVFKRFYRCNQSRQFTGNGLGLSLVAAIVKLHGFSIEIKDGFPGCVFELRCFAENSESNALPGHLEETSRSFQRIMGSKAKNLQPSSYISS